MIYLDNAATTKPLGEAIDFASVYNKDCYFNPSALYRGGLDAAKAVSDARAVILKYFGNAFDIIFTSCGSEADNTAIFGSARHGNYITTLGEHSAVYESFQELKNRGGDVKYAQLNKNGSVNIESLLSLVDDKTSFVSVVHVNNETGAINDINAIAKAVKEKNPRVVFHSDGVQAFGKLPYKISEDIDLYSVSAHKIGGLKGTGALIRKKTVHLFPLIFGGGQETGLRSGTENVFGITVFGYAAKKRFETLNEDYKRIGDLKKLFLSKLCLSNFTVISDENTSNYILSLSAARLRGEVLQHMLDDYGIIIGTGSACSSRHRHSRILTECGYLSEILDGALRVSFCSYTTEDEVIEAAAKLDECVKKLKKVMIK